MPRLSFRLYPSFFSPSSRLRPAAFHTKLRISFDTCFSHNQSTMTTPSILPEVPVKHEDFLKYVKANLDKPLSELLEPYKQYDAKLREIFAQEPTHPALADPLLNVVPVFNGHEADIKIRARNLDSETAEEKERYIMPLNDDERRPNGSPAIVQDINQFQQNFSLFSESSLVDMDWSNVVAAGSSVVTCLLPVPKKHNKSKRALREYYHEVVAPASDVDLFIYGLSEKEAIKKIIQIETKIKDSILTETTTIRTKNAITIASHYPVRQVQIVLRLYKSVSEILTGFDVDCSCAAYDGKQVYASPRALTAYMTQCNTIDLTRRSPSYENRLSKYSHRSFEVLWPLLDRSRIDPTIFERNFARTVGLARLLILERLPTTSERESYMDQRRRERGRPAINRFRSYSLQGNIKERHEDEVAEWVDQEEVSDYHTFTIPYGPNFHAKKIEKLLYTKDLLLNAEWNKPDDREVNLHRHPAFFGHAEDVIHDCCGYCPKPVTEEEHDVAKEEAKIYVSGDISFIRDDPGRQAIGSFNPITDDDWTEMAYVGSTARLCQAIIDGDLEHVEDWLQEGSDPNTRDYTGRTPLHLAVLASTPDVVRALINHGARLVARLADGRTALHLAAARGSVEMVKMILEKSEENEEEEARKTEVRKRASAAARQQDVDGMGVDKKETGSEEDIEMIDEDSDEDMQSTTTGSYIKIKEEEKKKQDIIPDYDDQGEPDIYDISVLAWDSQCSPLHLAILNGHVAVVRELVSTFGADVLLPIKLLNSRDKTPRGAILTLVLTLRLPLEKAKVMAQTLLEIGASSAQSDMKQVTALHYIAEQEPAVLETLLEYDEPAAKRAINHLSVHGSSWSPSAASPLMSAISKGNALAALKLLEAGANPNIEFKDWMKSVEMQYEDVSRRDAKRNQNDYIKDVEQPIILAVQAELPDVVLHLLSHGVDPNALTKQTQNCLVDEWYFRYNTPESLLDIVRNKIKKLKNFNDEKAPSLPELKLKEGVDYLQGIEPNSYKYFIAKMQIQDTKADDQRSKEAYEERLKKYNERKGVAEKKEAVEALAAEFERIETELLNRGAKTFKELHPDKIKEQSQNNRDSYSDNNPKPWEITFDFRVHDLTDETREAYLKLFQAAWDGDLATIKSLTLTPWGPEGDKMPLKTAVEDINDQSPFSLAVLRGHLDVARAIVEISYAQYQPVEEKEKARYRMGNEMENYDEDSEDDDASDSSEIPVYRQIIDEKFTIENIGEVSMQVKSRTSPLSFIGWTCTAWSYAAIFMPDQKFAYGEDNRTITRTGRLPLLRWSITTNDMNLFNFCLDLESEWTTRMTNKEDGCLATPSLSDEDFHSAIKYGRLEMLAKMIQHTGAGMKLESLVKRSGVKFQEKPKFYQGLSVHGKKRPDWTAAARGIRMRSITDTNPPLLEAAFKGSLASVEWFLSDTPARHYLAFAEAYKSDKLIKHLNTAAGGFDKVLSNWLGARRELAIHCAVMAEPRRETRKLLDYLIKVFPESIHIKSSLGHTPLALAFSLGRLEAAKTLIAAGADQTVRDANGNNILHLLLCSAYTSRCRDKKGLQDFLDVIDKRLISSLLTERSTGSLTPLARWMCNSYESRSVLNIFLTFAEPTGNEHLELLDGSGDTPIHQAVKSRKQDWLRIMLECRPDLLYRENATGRTPYEMAEDAYIASCVADAPSTSRYHSSNSILDRSAKCFCKDYKEPEYVTPESIWRLCEDFMKKHPGKRRLVSLLDANEVAKRLASTYKGRSSYLSNRARDDESDAQSVVGDTNDVTDEVSQWYSAAQYY
ncbi:ankyrin repeat protein [Zopfia rhizophila CBS 207.26]|uniref:Ankyrin repeat protein n=1 Tax=Zopfia rhizophila CBS 207.26 TaxID=1314779 RepID=A0A6A6EMV8_9PEZI|nr:ankyrin repeat protein [Zopfia rhizophila CBS 207.26]